MTQRLMNRLSPTVSTRLGVCLLLGVAMPCFTPPLHSASPLPNLASSLLDLDGPGWRLATDPKNVGCDERWFTAPRPEAVPSRVPWIIQETLVGYHGVAWFWREFVPPPNPHRAGRCLLRFWAVDYVAEVWVNDVSVGTHEGGEDPFVLDITEVVKPGATNRLAVRVLNPTTVPIDGILLAETPRRNKTAPYSPGSDFNYGGITDSVEWLLVPLVRVEDLFVRPDVKTGRIRIQANLRQAGSGPVKVRFEAAVAPAGSGETIATTLLDRQKVAVMPGESFGVGLAGWLRLSLTQPDERTTLAANRIAAHAASILGNAA